MNNNKDFEGQEMGGQFVSFTIDDEIFAINILSVQEIIGYIKPTHIPNMPDFINGMVNLRGQIIPIMCLRKKFNMQNKEYDKFSVIIILEIASKQIGIIVDAVSDVINLNFKDIKELPQVSDYKQEYIKGMSQIGDKLVVLLDIAKILSYDEYKKLHQIHN